VAVAEDFYKHMYDLHRKSAPKEEIVGWYATSVGGESVNYNSCLMAEFFADKMADPVHLVLDTSLRGDSLGMKAFHSRGIAFGDRTAVAAEFRELQLTTSMSGRERISVEQMITEAKGGDAGRGESKDGGEVKEFGSGGQGSTAGMGPLANMDALRASMANVISMLDKVSEYVDKVVAKQEEPNVEWGRLIANTIAAVPRIESEDFSKMFNLNLKDLLMVSYLSNLTRAQLAIAHKIQTSLENGGPQ
jgi:translation initiation factor 3 subunit F